MKPCTHPHLGPSLAMNGALVCLYGFMACKMKIRVEKQSLINPQVNQILFIPPAWRLGSETNSPLHKIQAHNEILHRTLDFDV